MSPREVRPFSVHVGPHGGFTLDAKGLERLHFEDALLGARVRLGVEVVGHVATLEPSITTDAYALGTIAFVASPLARSLLAAWRADCDGLVLAGAPVSRGLQLVGVVGPDGAPLVDHLALCSDARTASRIHAQPATPRSAPPARKKR